MPFLSFISSAHKFFRLTLLITLFLLLCFAVKGAFSGAARMALLPLRSTPVLTHRSAPSAALAAQAASAQSLLVLHFEGTLNGEGGETATQSSNVLFQPGGVTGQGVVIDRNSRLTYTSDGNINAMEGTIELWMKPSWNGNDTQSRTILKYGTNSGLLLSKEGTNLRLVLNRANENGSLELDVVSSTKTWQANQWHHIAASWSQTGQFLRLYVDGTLISERSLATILPTIDNTVNPTLQLGGDGVRNPLVATIDEVTISDAPRSPLDIAARMRQRITINNVLQSPNNSTVTMYKDWVYWQDLRFAADTTIGPLTLPAILGSLDTNVADIDPATGRIRAVGPGTTTVTATLGMSSVNIPVTVKSTLNNVVEEPIDATLGAPRSGQEFEIPVAIIRYIPTTNSTNMTVDSAVSGYTSPVAALKTNLTGLETKLQFILEEGSRFRAYKNSSVNASLSYKVVKIITVYEEVPPGLAATSTVYFPDYKQIFSRLNVKNWVEGTLGVKEIWLEQYVNGTIALNESNMASPLSGDISSSLRTNDDLPVFTKSYTVFGINFARTESDAARNHGHHLEALLSYANIRQEGDDLLFQDSFIGRDANGNFQIGRCGKTDRPPNSDPLTPYPDFNNAISVESDIKDWFPDESGVHESVNGNTWGSISYPLINNIESKWYIYWRQSIPGLGNTITRFGTEHMTNWWEFVANWDHAMQTKLGLTKAINCRYSLSSTSLGVLNSGGSNSVEVTAGAGCPWTAVSNANWITINAGGSGVSNGTVTFTVAVNAGGSRTGTLTIAGQTFTVTQASNNPAPTLSSIEPTTVVTGSAAFTLTLNGTGFVATSAVQVNGINRTTSFVDSTKLTIAMTAAEIAGAGTISIAVVNPAPGGGSSETRTLTINNPVPTLTTLSQTSAIVGSAELTLTLSGTNFISTSKVRWNGTDRTTTFGSATQLSATIPAADLASAGTANVTVFNPTPGGGTTSALTFTINNPSPSITVLAPNTVIAGSSAFTLTVSGTNFLASSVVRWNGNNRATTFGSSTQLAASITAADVATGGSANVTVFNSTPGGGASSAVTFSITSPCSYAIAPATRSFTSAGGNGSSSITTATGCAWTATSNDNWLTINAGSSSGSGNGTVNFAVAANTGASRNGTLTIAGKTFTVTQDAPQTPCVAQRTLPAEYIVGQALQVSVQVSPPASTQSHAIEDTPPSGWTVSGIDNGGQFDAVNGKVKWGPFFDATARTLKYSVTPPSGMTGQKTFSGTVSINGTSSTMCGNSSIESANLFHPADLNNNLRIEINELTAYGAAWKAGTAWSRPPNPIDINYVTNAGLIWKLGEIYHYDASKTPPFAAGASISERQPAVPSSMENTVWLGTEERALKMLQANGFMPGPGFGMVTAMDAIFATNPAAIAGGAAVAGFNAANYTPGVGITVTINVTPDAGTQVYAVEETIPLGWTVSSINTSGAFDSNNRKVKWGPFFDNAVRSLTYVATPPAGETGSKTFAGTGSFDGLSVSVAGARTLSPAASCTYALGAANQTLNAVGGTGSFTIMTAAGCAWNATTNDSWITFTQSSGSGNGAVNYAAAANAGAARAGTISVGGQTFTVNQSANAAPTITPVAALTRQQGASANAVTIATISDTETALGNLVVTTISVPTGLSVTELTNTNGAISAIITASCLATSGANTIGLKVTDAQGAFAQANLTVNVTSSPNCFLQIPDASSSDQRLGSVLLFSFYTSNLSSPGLHNTQIRLTNTNETQDTAVRLYLVDGQTSSVFSLFVCLPPNQTIPLLMSETDPGVTGYIIAVAVSKTSGCPTNFNFLAGRASIKLSSGHTANLGAVAIAALATNPTSCAAGNTAATLNFDGTNYGRLPRLLMVDNLGSVKDGNDTRLIVTRVGGSLVGNAGAVGAITGKIYNGNRAAQDFSFSASGSQFVSSLSNNFPRLTTRLDLFIPSGQSGWMKLWTDANWGIIGSVLNLPSNPRTPNAFAGGFNLQQGALAGTVSLVVPISVSTCQ